MKFENEFELYLKRLGKRIQGYRERAKLTQEHMSEGNYPIDYKYYQRIESGKRNLTLRTLFKISKKLNVPMKDLLNVKLKK